MNAPNTQAGHYAALVERINRNVRDRGDVELVMMLDSIVDKETEPERTATLGAVVKIIKQGRKGSTEGGTT